MRFGAHVSTSGGLRKTIERATEITAECVQIFCSAPGNWAPPAMIEPAMVAFRQDMIAAGLGPLVIHAIYLINLGTPRDDHFARSVGAIVADLRCGATLGALGVVVHIGSSKDWTVEESEQRVADGLRQALAGAPNEVAICLETSAGQGQCLGVNFEQIRRIIDLAGGDPRLQVCLDTAHVFGAGYDMSTPAGVTATIDAFDREIGLDRLSVIHCNDSKVPLGSLRDRHENIGAGHIGLEGFRALLRDPRLSHLPCILEVPGVDKGGPDAANLAILRELATADAVTLTCLTP